MEENNKYSLKENLRRVVDARAGIATALWELPEDAACPGLFVAATTGPEPSYYINHDHVTWSNTIKGSGAGFTRDAALKTTIGEHIERYAASIYDPPSLRYCTAAQLAEPTIKIDKAILYTQAQYLLNGFPYCPYENSEPRHWRVGKDLLSGEAIWAPAQMVYLSQGWHTGEKLTQSCSTGLACGESIESAMLSALLELIERDGFACAWRVGYPPPRLKLSSNDRASLPTEVLRFLDEEDFKISLRASPNALGIPTIFAFSEHSRLGIGAVGAASRLSTVDAVSKAVIESLHGWVELHRYHLAGKPIPAREDVRMPREHALFYSNPESWAELQWFLQSSDTVTSTDLQGIEKERSFQSLAKDLHSDLGVHTSAYDVTTCDAASLGFVVLRVLAPGLQPLLFGARDQSQDRRRLDECAAYWGIKAPDILNEKIHPFP